MTRYPLPLLFLFLAGCSLTDFASFSASQNCTSTYDCSPGDVCHFGECIQPGGDAGSVLLVMAPPPYSGIPTQEDTVGPRRAVPGAFHLVTLSTAPRVQGNVAIPSGEARTGTLTFVGERQVTGAANTTTALVGPEGFTVDLMPDNYTTSFMPDDSEERPPFQWGSIEIPAEGLEDLILPYPDDSEMITVTGTLLYTDYPAQPVIGAEVSGEYIDDSGTMITSSPTTTDENGRYSLVFPGSLSTYQLKVSPGENYFIPETIVSGLRADEEAVASMNLLPSPQTFTVLTTSDNGEPIPETTLYFQGIVQEYATEAASFRFALQTGQDAQATVNLLPGNYTVTAIPPRSTNASISVQNLCIAGADLENSLCYVSDVGPGETLNLPLGTKTTFTGRVVSAFNEAVPASQVSLSTFINGQRLDAQTTTDSKGFFSLRVDVSPDPDSIYTLRVQPGPQLALPMHQESFKLSESTGTTIVKLPAASLFAGRMASETGLSVENVAISVYSVDRDTDGPVLIGVGTSTAAGEFLIPLPAQED